MVFLETDVRPGLPRILEIVLAGAGLIMLGPLLFLAALGVRLSSPGPVVFRQERVGLGGRSFTLMKFRTMRMANDGPQVTTAGDSRGDTHWKVPSQGQAGRTARVVECLSGGYVLCGAAAGGPRLRGFE